MLGKRLMSTVEAELGSVKLHYKLDKEKKTNQNDFNTIPTDIQYTCLRS